MSESDDVLSYAEVRSLLPQTGRSHLLLGNGFSIGCDPVFAYGSLYSFVEPQLPPRVQQLFAHWGTNNFEQVMRGLEDSAWMDGVYAMGCDHNVAKLVDLGLVKQRLLEAVAQVHLPRPSDIQKERLALCVEFLRPFHNVFSLNYDLLLYWVEMHGLSVLRGRDGFRDSEDDPDADYCVFSEHIGSEKGIFFIHGALHLYVAGGEVRKHTWAKTGRPLIELVQEGLQEGLYPLFVAEGDSPKKREQILGNGYLDYCYGKLHRIEGPLVTLGWSIGKTDQHIADAIVRNRKLKELYVGLHQPDSSQAKTVRQAALNMALRKVGAELKVSFFDAATAVVWGAPESHAAAA